MTATKDEIEIMDLECENCGCTKLFWVTDFQSGTTVYLCSNCQHTFQHQRSPHTY